MSCFVNVSLVMKPKQLIRSSQSAHLATGQSQLRPAFQLKSNRNCPWYLYIKQPYSALNFGRKQTPNSPSLTASINLKFSAVAIYYSSQTNPNQLIHNPTCFQPYHSTLTSMEGCLCHCQEGCFCKCTLDGVFVVVYLSFPGELCL